MEVDSVATQPTANICDDESSDFFDANDILVFDKNFPYVSELIDDQRCIRQYKMGCPIGYALLVGSCQTPEHEQPSLSIYRDLKLMNRVLNGCGWTVYSPCFDKTDNHVNLSSERCNQILEDVEQMSSTFQRYSCFMFYYSGHGIAKGVVLNDGKVVPYKSIVKRISKIPSLQHKPKIFIFDSCRDHVNYSHYESKELSNRNDETYFSMDIERNNQEEKEPDGYPSPDTVICFSAAEGTPGVMEKEAGSVYTLQLAHALLQFGHRLTFVELLIQVNGGTVRIARHIFRKKQQPVVVNTLTGMLVLNVKGLSHQPRDVVMRDSAHSESMNSDQDGEFREAQQKGPYFLKHETHDNDVVKDGNPGEMSKRKQFTTRQDVESQLPQLGEGVSVFVVYAPYPDSPYFNPQERKAEIDRNEHLVYGLVYDLELHGFHVVSDLHLKDTELRNWLQWYTSRLKLCDYVIIVCSPAFNEIFSHGQRPDRQIIDERTKLLLSYRNAMYTEIVSEVQTNGSGSKFIPVLLDPMWSADECVPVLFRLGSIYQVVEQPPIQFTYDNKSRGFEKLVCRMAGIDREKLDRPQNVAVHQLGDRHHGVVVDRRYHEAMKKPRVGYKVVKPALIQPPSSGFGASSGFGGAPSFIPTAGPQIQPLGFNPYLQQQAPLMQGPPPQQQQPSQAYPNKPPISHVPPQVNPLINAHPPQGMATPSTLIPHPSIIPDKAPETFTLLWLSQRIARWKFIARYLGLQEHEIDRIELENPGDTNNQCFKMLSVWERQRKTKYSCRTLGEVLLNSQQNKDLYIEFVKKVNEH